MNAEGIEPQAAEGIEPQAAAWVVWDAAPTATKQYNYAITHRDIREYLDP